MSDLYAAARNPAGLADCHFYHTMDLPGHGLVNGEWDLRGGLDAYLGHVDFRGKRVLDVGAANGQLSFHMEQRGAEVVSYDLSSSNALALDVAPSRYGQQRHLREYRAYMEFVNNGYWLAHQAFGSKAKMVYGTVYDIPAEIGPVDISVFGMLLLHLRDPLLALQNALRLTTEKVIVAEPIWAGRQRWLMNLYARLVGPYVVFKPRYWTPKPQVTWWHFSLSAMQSFLAGFGFERMTTTWHRQLYKGVSAQVYTIVAERTQPREDFGLDESSR